MVLNVKNLRFLMYKNYFEDMFNLDKAISCYKILLRKDKLFYDINVLLKFIEVIMYETYLIKSTIMERNMTWFEAFGFHQDVFFSNLCLKSCQQGIKVQS